MQLNFSPLTSNGLYMLRFFIYRTPYLVVIDESVKTIIYYYMSFAGPLHITAVASFFSTINVDTV